METRQALGGIGDSNLIFAASHSTNGNPIVAPSPLSPQSRSTDGSSIADAQQPTSVLGAIPVGRWLFCYRLDRDKRRIGAKYDGIIKNKKPGPGRRD